MHSFAIYVAVVGILGLSVSLTEAQLLYNASDISDGDCSAYPSAVPITDINAAMVALPGYNNYLPLASKLLYRFEYQMLTTKPADTEDQILSLQTRVLAIAVGGVLQDPRNDFTVTFFQNSSSYSYQCLPNGQLNPPSVLNFNCLTKAATGSSSSPDGYGGQIVFTVIWSDGSAFLVWGCIGGGQNFHVISRTPTLNADQMSNITSRLDALNFSRNNYQNMLYPDNSPTASILNIVNQLPLFVG